MKTWNPYKFCEEDRKDIEAFVEEYKHLCRKHNMKLGSHDELHIEDIHERDSDFNFVTVYLEERN